MTIMPALAEDFPVKGTVFVHHSGRRYVFDRVTNRMTLTDPDPARAAKFPVMATYFIEGQEANPDSWFSRPLAEFLSNATPA